MMTVRRKNRMGEWVDVTTTARKSGAVEFARLILPAIYFDLCVDDEDVKYFNEEFEKQASSGGEVYIESIICIDEGV